MIPKFRMWDKENESWIDIKSLGMIEGEITILESWDDDLPYFIEDLGKTWELMQSTGLTDKNGKEIFEGDVVKYWENIGYIEFYQGSWVINWNNGSLFDLYDNETNLEIIGNIHEHTDLLK